MVPDSEFELKIDNIVIKTTFVLSKTRYKEISIFDGTYSKILKFEVTFVISDLENLGK